MLRSAITATITACLLLAPGVSFCAWELNDHPRIFITSENLPELARRATGTGMLADDYALIRREADYFVEQQALKRPDSKWHPPHDMICSALAYLVERELGNPEADKYAAAVKEVWGDGIILTNIGNGHFGNYAVVYDWIYDYLSEEDRIFYADRLAGWLYYYTNTPEITLLNGDWLYNQTWGPAHLNTGNTRDGITPKLLVALALAGSGTSYEAACSSFIDSWDSRVPDECIPEFDRMGGVWSESFGHGSYGPTKVIPWAFEAWRTATGQDWFGLGSDGTYLKRMNEWAVHLQVPFSGRTAYIDDNSGSPLADQWVETGPILGARYQDPVANQVTTEYERDAWREPWIFIPWKRFILYDPQVPALTAGREGWPLASLFGEAGHVYMRSAWDDPDATWAFFGSGPQFAGHSRDDEGHFMISRKGWLVLRAGGMGHNDSDYYAGGSLVFNIATIFDPDEQFRRTDPGQNAVNNGGTRNERDGGTMRYVYSTSGGDRAEIKAYKHTGRYTYAAGDLSRAYRSGKAREVTRQFLYLRGEHEYFVIFDRVDAKSADFPKHWFLHIPTEPEIDGTETELVPEHVYEYTGAGTATWLSSHAGLDSSDVLSSGRSRARLTSLWPEGATITRRGGEGHEFWGHPDEPTAQYNHAGSESDRVPVVNWRLEIEAPAGEEREYFLNVLEVSDEEDSSPASCELIDNGDGGLGVRIEKGSDDPVEVMFMKTGAMNASLRFGSGQYEELSEVVDTTTTGQASLEGDLNGDGELGLADVVEMLDTGRKYPRYPPLDYNNDGSFDIFDVIGLLLTVVKNPT